MSFLPLPSDDEVKQRKQRQQHVYAQQLQKQIHAKQEEKRRNSAGSASSFTSPSSSILSPSSLSLQSRTPTDAYMSRYQSVQDEQKQLKNHIENIRKNKSHNELSPSSAASGGGGGGSKSYSSSSSSPSSVISAGLGGASARELARAYAADMPSLLPTSAAASASTPSFSSPANDWYSAHPPRRPDDSDSEFARYERTPSSSPPHRRRQDKDGRYEYTRSLQENKYQQRDVERERERERDRERARSRERRVDLDVADRRHQSRLQDVAERKEYEEWKAKKLQQQQQQQRQREMEREHSHQHLSASRFSEFEDVHRQHERQRVSEQRHERDRIIETRRHAMTPSPAASPPRFTRDDSLEATVRRSSSDYPPYSPPPPRASSSTSHYRSFSPSHSPSAHAQRSFSPPRSPISRAQRSFSPSHSPSARARRSFSPSHSPSSRYQRSSSPPPPRSARRDNDNEYGGLSKAASAASLLASSPSRRQSTSFARKVDSIWREKDGVFSSDEEQRKKKEEAMRKQQEYQQALLRQIHEKEKKKQEEKEEKEREKERERQELLRLEAEQRHQIEHVLATATGQTLSPSPVAPSSSAAAAPSSFQAPPSLRPSSSSSSYSRQQSPRRDGDRSTPSSYAAASRSRQYDSYHQQQQQPQHDSERDPHLVYHGHSYRNAESASSFLADNYDARKYNAAAAAASSPRRSPDAAAEQARHILHHSHLDNFSPRTTASSSSFASYHSPLVPLLQDLQQRSHLTAAGAITSTGSVPETVRSQLSARIQHADLQQQVYEHKQEMKRREMEEKLIEEAEEIRVRKEQEDLQKRYEVERRSEQPLPLSPAIQYAHSPSKRVSAAALAAEGGGARPISSSSRTSAPLTLDALRSSSSYSSYSPSSSPSRRPLPTSTASAYDGFMRSRHHPFEQSLRSSSSFLSLGHEPIYTRFSDHITPSPPAPAASIAEEDEDAPQTMVLRSDSKWIMPLENKQQQQRPRTSPLRTTSSLSTISSSTLPAQLKLRTTDSYLHAASPTSSPPRPRSATAARSSPRSPYAGVQMSLTFDPHASMSSQGREQ